MSSWIYAAKTTSTVCLLWSAYLLARTRVWSKRNDDTVICEPTAIITNNNHNDRNPERSSDQLPNMDDNNASHLLEFGDCFHDRTTGSSECDNSFLTPVTSESLTTSASTASTTTTATSIDSNSSSSLYHKTVQRLYNIFYLTVSKVNSNQPPGSTPDQTVPLTDFMTNVNMEDNYSAELHRIAKIIADLGDKAGLTTQIRTRRFLRLDRPAKVTADGVMQMLIEFSKDSRFLDKSLNTPELQYVISWFANLMLHMTKRDYKSDFTLSNSPNTSIRDTISTNDQLAETSVKSSSQLLSDSDYSQPDILSSFQSCLCFAMLLANLSRHSSSHFLTQIEDVTTLIPLWKESPSSRLNIYASKIEHNLSVHCSINQGANQSSCCDATISDQNCTSPTSSKTQLTTPIYFPDIYRLDVPRSCAQDYDFDIVFVNGMLGSVFHTWRQHDSMVAQNNSNKHQRDHSYTHCWPRDWLANEFPNARIIGVDTSLKPFVWNRLCPKQKLRRSLDDRALDIIQQLLFAGVGDRPVIWITHSAGGILVKEMLRLTKSVVTSDNSVNFPSEDVVYIPPMDCLPISSKTNQPTKRLRKSHANDTVSAGIISGKSSLSTVHSSSDVHTEADDDDQLFVTPHPIYPPLSDQTKAIVFISTPHRGNQSLFALYKRPFRWILTPEAIQLERNCEYLIDLHKWFDEWAKAHAVQIFSLVETRVTAMNRFWSVLLVPEDENDRELGEIIRVDADHLDISKPKSINDPVYANIVMGIRQQAEKLISSPSEHQSL